MSDLAQDLANKLGLKGRKAYVSLQTESTAAEGESHGETSPPNGEVGTVVAVLSYILATKRKDKPVLFFFCLTSDVLQWAGISG